MDIWYALGLLIGMLVNWSSEAAGIEGGAGAGLFSSSSWYTALREWGEGCTRYQQQLAMGAATACTMPSCF
jgi:hypothetical protein